MTQPEARAIYDRVVAELAAKGLTMPGPWVLEFDKARKRLGCCVTKRSKFLGVWEAKPGGSIRLSRHLVELNTAETVEATIRHEIAHAIAGHAAGHGPEWVRIALLCGSNGKRCHDDEGLESAPMPWIGTCPVCGRETGRTRPVKPGRMFSCGKCAPGRFDKRFVLAFRMRQTEFVSENKADAVVLKSIIQLRQQGLGWVKVDAALGVFGKKGFHSWKIFNDAARAAGGTGK